MTKRLIFPIIAAASISGAYAQIWTYSDCVDYARNHNITLQKTRLSEQTSEYDLTGAEAEWYPTLDFTTSHSYTNRPWGEPSANSYTGNVGLNAGWTMWDGGVRKNTIERNRLNLERSRIATSDYLRSIETDLLQVYLNILYAREAIEISRSAVELSQAQAARALQLMEAGKMSRVDYAQLNSQYEQDKYNLVNAEGTYNSRRMELKQLLELGLDTAFEPATVNWSDSQILAALPPLDESYELALKTDLTIRGLELDKEMAQVNVKIAKAGLAPKISLNASVGTGYYTPGGSFGNTIKQSWNEQIGVGVSIPILDNKKTATAVAKANVDVLNAQYDIDRRQTILAQLVETWFIDTRSAQSRFKAATSQLESAKLTDDLTNERFKLGYIDPIELLTSHNALIEARHTLLQSKYMAILGQKMIEFYRTATITLN